MIEFNLMIQNKKGLHARASAKFVEIVESLDAECEISRNDMAVSGDSIMGLLMLAATKGSFVKVKAWGAQYKELEKAIRNLVNNRFGEDC